MALVFCFLALFLMTDAACAQNVVRRTANVVAAVNPFAQGQYVPETEVVQQDAPGLYNVRSQNLQWRSNLGKNYSALIWFPTTPPLLGQKFSVVVYSHGLGASAEQFSYLGKIWARHGVVTILLRHPESDESVWRGKLRPMNELKEAYHKYWSARDRALAIRSAIDLVYSSNRSAGPLGADVDLERIGVAGNDLGALAALQVAGQLPPDNGASLKDTRVSCVLAMSPTVFCDAASGAQVYANIDVPTMVVTGTNDNGIVGQTKAHERRIPYDNIREADRYLVTLRGGDHRVYGGHALPQKQAQVEPYHETISIATTDFFVAYLQADSTVMQRMRAYAYSNPLSNAQVESSFGRRAVKDYDVGESSRPRRAKRSDKTASTVNRTNRLR
ncbi:MAG: hypothetical protein Q4G03_03195 [Planctomycetia bacterium]|nr:hypothetical protein [Planctomycetia bacterium]